MEIRFELSPEDAWEYSKFLRLKVPKVRNITIANFLICFLLILIISRNLVYSLCSLVIIIIIQFLLIRQRAKKKAANTPGILGEHIITITEEGLREKTAVNDSFHSWLGVIDILENKKYIFIFIEELRAHVIPKKAFADPETAKNFFNTALEYWKIANSKKI